MRYIYIPKLGKTGDIISTTDDMILVELEDGTQTEVRPEDVLNIEQLDNC